MGPILRISSPWLWWGSRSLFITRIMIRFAAVGLAAFCWIFRLRTSLYVQRTLCEKGSHQLVLFCQQSAGSFLAAAASQICRCSAASHPAEPRISQNTSNNISNDRYQTNNSRNIIELSLPPNDDSSICQLQQRTFCWQQ